MTADKISTCRLNPAADVTRTITLATVSLPSRTHVPHYQPAAAAADDTVDACIKVTSSDRVDDAPSGMTDYVECRLVCFLHCSPMSESTQ